MSPTPSGPDAPAVPPEIMAALREGFDGRLIEGLAPLGGGLSRSPIFTFSVDGADYVVRKSDPERTPHAIGCTRIASARGIAPRLVHAVERTGVSISERVAGTQLAGTGGDPRIPARVAITLRRLHDGPAFPVRETGVELLRTIDQGCAAAGRSLPADLFRAVEDAFACTQAYVHAAPCHRDLNPNNILLTPDRVVFIDWDTAAAGDPFLDVAQLGVFAFPSPEQREAFLSAYLGRAATDEEQARAIVARVMALAFYAAAFERVTALTGGRPHAEGMPLGQLFATLATSRERTDPALIAASLLLEVRRERSSTAFAGARARLSAASAD
ncbi:MAG TPA: phosphotransferase [Polyangiaceae bacterium]|jgi:hypothetical protein